jgi:hypothetical protein
MRVSVSDPARLRRLLAFLAFDATAVVTLVNANEVEVSFTGSLNSYAQRCELERRLRAWVAAHPDVVVTVDD